MELVQLLLAAGAETNPAQCALTCACDEGHAEVARMLLEAGADISVKRIGPAFYRACKKGRIEVVQRMLPLATSSGARR